MHSMASHGQRQQWQQPPPQQQHLFDQRNDPRAWQGDGQPQRMPQHRHQQYNDHQNFHNGYNNYGAQQYEQPEHWQDQQYQEPYQPNGNGHYNEPRAQPQGPDRNYQYDERYRANGDGRAHQSNGNGFNDAQRPREKRRPSHNTAEKRQKPRERILTEPTSPKTLAWDNPFGAFPPKKKGHDKHASLDKGLGRLSVGADQEVADRPQTSQDYRRKETSRPSTSHGHLPEPLQSRPPEQDMPLQKPPPGPSRKEGPLQQPGIIGLPARPAPQRAVTQPPPTAKPNGARYKEYGSVDPYGYEQQQQHNRDAHRQPIIQQAPPVAAERRPSEDTYTRSASQPRNEENHYNHSYRGVPLSKPPSNQSADMPNFEAIPTPVNEKAENLFPITQKTQEKPAYAKKTYQALPPPSIKTAAPSSTAVGSLNSPLSDFAFDIPPPNMAPVRYDNPSASSPIRYDNPASNTPVRYDNPPLSPTRRQEYKGQRQYDPRVKQLREQENPPRQQTPTSQFPPRTASRGDTQPRSALTPANDTRNWPKSSEQGNFHQGGGIPVRKRSQPKDFNRNAAYEQAHDPYTYDPSYDYGQTHGDGSSHEVGNHYHQDPTFGQDRQPPPVRGPAPASHVASPVRPPALNAAHPIPVRHYGDSTNSDNSRPTTGNPDALPSHPAPIRPGLMGGGTQSPAPKSTPAVQRREPTVPRVGADDGKNGPVTIEELNKYREQFTNNPNDCPLGLKFAKRLVEAATVLASENGRADQKQTAKNRERYILDAHKIVKKLVNANYPDAMFYLADCHGQGLLGLAPDPKEAFQLYQSAAKLNHPQSAYRVAVCCELGNEEGGGTRRDPLKAIQWYKRAATLGDTPAMYKMGMILLKGLLGQPRNPREAVSWLKRASERADPDNPHALHELGLLYESASPTDHIVRDEKYALQLFMQAADLGYKYSQFRLGSAFEYGLLGCTIEPRQSIAWYTRAAAQGEHQAELALSGWYLTGSDPLLQQSDTEAYLWARKAASSGLAKAEYAMGYFTEVGIGTTVDIEEAKRWYYRAAAQNFPKARERLEDLRKGGQKMTKTRVSRSHVGKQNEGECVVM